MASPTAAMNLLEYAQFTNDPKIQKIAVSMIDAGSVTARLPIKYRKSFNASVSRIMDNMPTWGGTKLNDGGTDMKAAPRRHTEQLYIARRRVPIDHLLKEEENAIADPEDVQLDAVMKAHTYWRNETFFKNTPTLDGDWTTGLYFRLDNPSTYGVSGDLKIDAGGIVMTDAGMTGTTFQALLKQINTLFLRLDAPEGMGVDLFVGERLKMQIDMASALFTGQGGFRTDKDQIGRTVLKYKEANIIFAGYKAPTGTGYTSVQSNILQEETAAGADSSSAGNDYASIVGVKFDQTNGLFGWSFEGPKVYDSEKVPGEYYEVTKVEDTLGMLHQSHRAFGRILNIKVK